jgi:hypothetical protein
MPAWQIWLGAALIGLGLYYAAQEFLGLGPIPQCDQVTEDLQHLFDTAPYQRHVGLTAISASGFRQVSDERSSGNIRRCVATIHQSNSKDTRVDYAIYRNKEGVMTLEFTSAP